VAVGDRVVAGEAGEADAGADAELRLTGDAVELLEALSVRRPLAQPIPPASAWLIDHLATVFDAAPT
jgi:hypothetical protein